MAVNEPSSRTEPEPEHKVCLHIRKSLAIRHLPCIFYKFKVRGRKFLWPHSDPWNPRKLSTSKSLGYTVRM